MCSLDRVLWAAKCLAVQGAGMPTAPTPLSYTKRCGCHEGGPVWDTYLWDTLRSPSPTETSYLTISD